MQPPRNAYSARHLEAEAAQRRLHREARKDRARGVVLVALHPTRRARVQRGVRAAPVVRTVNEACTLARTQAPAFARRTQPGPRAGRWHTGGATCDGRPKAMSSRVPLSSWMMRITCLRQYTTYS